jgi:hypothetical protein
LPHLVADLVRSLQDRHATQGSALGDSQRPQTLDLGQSDG